MNLKNCIVLLVVTASVSSCKLKRPSLPAVFPGTVSPTVVCPGQNITVNWDVASLNEACASDAAACKRDPLTVEVSATGGMSFKESPAAFTGSKNGVATGPDDVTISIHAFDSDQDLGTSTVKVTVLSHGKYLDFDGTCEGYCDNEKAAAAWRDLAVDFKGSSLSDVIALKKIKNTNAVDVALTVRYQNGETGMVNLKAGQTSSDFTSRIKTISAKATVADGDCKTGKAPSPLKFTVSFGCL
ncbi:MAG: hypothetical protein K2X48_17445 [Chitinophagaceae bacterium]|nr:hypothetical protein [Chitinophagaceae bacterium]